MRTYNLYNCEPCGRVSTYAHFTDEEEEAGPEELTGPDLMLPRGRFPLLFLGEAGRLSINVR